MKTLKVKKKKELRPETTFDGRVAILKRTIRDYPFSYEMQALIDMIYDLINSEKRMMSDPWITVEAVTKETEKIISIRKKLIKRLDKKDEEACNRTYNRKK